MKKTLTLILAFALVLALGIGGTLAWLAYATDPITNTFTLGDLTADFYETDDEGNEITVTNDFGTVSPGQVLHKDPTIEITKGDSGWVFIGVNNPNEDMITFTPNTGWSEVGTYTDDDDVEYIVYGFTTEATAGTAYILFDEVTISEDATNAGDGTELEDITVIGFAVQADAGTTAQFAWDATFGE